MDGWSDIILLKALWLFWEKQCVWLGKDEFIWWGGLLYSGLFDSIVAACGVVVWAENCSFECISWGECEGEEKIGGELICFCSFSETDIGVCARTGENFVVEPAAKSWY